MPQIEIKKKLLSSRKDLLDIGLRNNMINFRRSAKNLMIVDELSEEVLNILYRQNKTMTFLPMPKKHLKQLASSQSAEDQTADTQDESTLELLHELEGVNWGALMGADGESGTTRRHTDTKLQTALTEDRLFLNLLKIHTEAETYIQEQGVNVLFLALGFLHWYEADATDKLRKAPLLLVPVEIKRGGAKESFQLEYTGDDLIPNLSLAAKLKTDFALNLPQYVTDSSAEADDMPSLTEFFTAVSGCISKQKRWKVAPDEMHLGFFSFGKFLMFNDLDPSIWPEGKQPSNHPVLGRLLGDGFVDETPAVAESVHLDSVIAPGEVRFVRDADSSQTLAILEARAGRNLVIQGPPGTGKSQTITNIIAEFLGCGKTILFVAEKMAALEVVKRRLDENHLGDAVLELHSHKATKQSVLKELARTLDQGRPLAKDGSDEIEALKRARDELNAYCEAVNAPIGISNVPFIEALGHYLQLKRARSDLPVWSFEPMKNWSQKDQVRLREKVSELAMQLQEMGQPSNNPFWGSRRNTFSPVEHNQATEMLNQAIAMFQNISGYAGQLAAHLGLGRPVTLAEVDIICRAAQRATEAPHLKGIRLSTNEWQNQQDAIRELLDAGKLMTEAQANINAMLIENPGGQGLPVERQHQGMRLSINEWQSRQDAIRKSLEAGKLMAEAQENINAAFVEHAWEQDLQVERQHLVSYGDKWWRFLSGKFRKSQVKLQGLCQSPLPKDNAECLSMIDGIIEYQQRKQTCNQYAALAKELYGAQWSENRPDWEALGHLSGRVIALYDDLEKSSLPTGILDFLSSHPDVSKCLFMIDGVFEYQQRKRTYDKHASLGKTLYGTQWSDHRSDWNALGHLSEWIIALYDDLEKSLLPSGILDFLSAHPDAARLVEDIARIRESVKALRLQLEELVKRLALEETFPANSLLALPLNELNDRLQLWLKELPKLYQLARFNQLNEEMVALGLNEVVEKAAHWQHKSTDLVNAFDLTWYSGLVEQGYANSPQLLKFDHVKQAHLLDKFRRLDQSSLGHAQTELAKSIWDRMPSINQPGEMAVIRNELNKKRRLMPIRQLIEQAGRAIQHIKPVFMMSPMSIANFLPPGKLEFDVVIFDEASQVKAVDAFGAMLRGRQVIVVGDTRQMPPTDFFSREIETDEEDNTTSDIESVLSMFRARGAQERYLSWHYRSRHESLIAVSNVEFYDRRLVIFPSPGTNKHATGLKFRHLPEAIYDRGRTRTNRLEAKAVAQAVMAHAENNPELSLGVVAFSMAQRDLIQIEVELLRRENPAVDAYFNGAHPTEPFFVKNLENVQGDERDVIFISIGYGRNESGRIAKEFGPINREGGERRLNVLISRAKMGMEVFCNFRADELELDPYASHGARALKHFLKYAETRVLDIPKETGKQADSPFEMEVIHALQERGYQVESQVGTAGYFIDIAVKDPEFLGRYILAIECDGASYHSSRSARDRDRLRQGVLESLGWRFHRIWSTDWFRDSAQELERTVAAIEAARQAIKLDKPVEATIKPVKEPVIKRKAVGEDASVTDDMAYYKASLRRPKSAAQALHEIPADYLAELIKMVVDIEAPVHETEVTKRLMESFGVSRAGSRISENVGVAIKHGHRNGMFHYAGGFVYTDKTRAAKARNRSAFEPSERNIELIAKEELDVAILDVVRMGFSISQDAAVSGALDILGFGRASANIVDTMNARIKSLLKAGHLKRHEDKLVVIAAGNAS